MADTVKRYPLYWPMRWPRTTRLARRRASFAKTVHDAGPVRQDGTRQTFKRTKALAAATA